MFRYKSLVLTFTFEALSEETVEERTAVVTEGGGHEVVGLETVGNVDFKPLP